MPSASLQRVSLCAASTTAFFLCIAAPALAAAADPANPTPPATWSRLGAPVLLLIALSILVLSLVMWVVLKTSRRITRGPRESRPARAAPQAERPDPWFEAGRRMPTPPDPDAPRPRTHGQPLMSARTPAPRPAAPRPIALITGAARRVGAAIADELARAGCDVMITYNSSADAAQRTVASLRRHNVAAAAMPLDITDEDDLIAAARHIARELPRLDVLVHNASTYEPSPFGEIDAARMVEDYRVHAVGPLLLTQALWPLLKKSVLEGGASVVAMADMHVLGRPRKEFASYAMSKAALVEMVQTLARVMAPKVRVNAIAPGVVAWPTSGSESSAALRAAYLKRVPLSRAGTPQDAARAVRWLALESPYITGEVVRVDGGRWLT